MTEERIAELDKMIEGIKSASDLIDVGMNSELSEEEWNYINTNTPQF